MANGVSNFRDPISSPRCDVRLICRGVGIMFVFGVVKMYGGVGLVIQWRQHKVNLYWWCSHEYQVSTQAQCL
jgi:hypothetical protein